MKQFLVFGLVLVLLTACGKQAPAYTDNGNPGQIKATVFYDDNKNGVMDSGESGVSQTPGAISQEISCPPSSYPNWVNTDLTGVIIFKDLKPRKYCVVLNSPFSTSKASQEVYVSSDTITEVTFGISR